MSIFGFFKKAISKVSDLFVAVFGSKAAQDFGDAAVNLLKTEIGKIAITAVSTAGSLFSTNAAARAEAFREIKSEAKRAGIDVKDHMVYLLIELAVARFKGSITEA